MQNKRENCTNLKAGVVAAAVVDLTRESHRITHELHWNYTTESHLGYTE